MCYIFKRRGERERESTCNSVRERESKNVSVIFFKRKRESVCV